MYTVIGTPKTRGFRVIWMLEELGQNYEVEPCGPHAEAITEVNPSGKVPALKDGEDIVIDSVAICQYLADKHGAATAPAGTIERAKQDSFTQFALDEVDAILWTNARHSFVLPEEHRVEAVKATCKWEFGRSMGVLAERLGDNDYVMGAEFTVPDLILGHCAGWAMNTPGWDLPDGKLGDYFKRVRSRPAFEKAWEVRERT
ncbi:MAG: glutathione S-transferase family protein [Alphaproteobacteria bacterium]|nr:glutathione S-transferase family protein [Alphaproteobacteria bacterium]